MKITVSLGLQPIELEVTDYTDAVEVYEAALEAGCNEREAAQVVELVDVGDFFTE
jgi:hypothetical protein